jgi:hypothetical protein
MDIRRYDAMVWLPSLPGTFLPDRFQRFCRGLPAVINKDFQNIASVIPLSV